MRTTIFLPLMLCCVVAAAQDNTVSQTLPELQEWYSWKGKSGHIINYLPGFDSLGGGLNAITQRRSSSNTPTWYNRFRYDTINHFSWPNHSGSYIVFGDFNGDGNRDYWGSYDRVFRGIKNGAFPNKTPDTNYDNQDANGYRWVGDFNNDGYDDVFQQWNTIPELSDPLFRIIWGGSDLKRLKQTISDKLIDIEANVIGIFKNEQGQWRIITHERAYFYDRFNLYALNVLPSTGDTPKIQLQLRDLISEQNPAKNEYYFSDYFNHLYWNKRTGQNYLTVTKSGKEGETKDTTIGYTIVNNKFIFLRKNAVGGAEYSYLSGSIDGDDKEDFIAGRSIKIDGTSYRSMAIVPGLPLDKSEPISPVAFFRRPLCGYSEWISYIGDVNHDDIGDLAYGGSDGCFSVYLGLDWRKVSVNEITEINSLKVHQNIPNPVQKDRKTLLPVSLKQQGSYTITLYSLQGNKIKELFTGELSEGEHNIPLDLMGLSAGMYIVKMNNGSISRERAIMIGE